MPRRDRDALCKSLGPRNYSSDGQRKRNEERRQQMLQKIRDREERDLANRLVKYGKFGITLEFYKAVSVYEQKKRRLVDEPQEHD
jgi:hypothetical protein